MSTFAKLNRDCIIILGGLGDFRVYKELKEGMILEVLSALRTNLMQAKTTDGFIFPIDACDLTLLQEKEAE